MAFLEISTGIRCGMSCSYCPRDAIEKAYTGPRLLSLETFKAALANTPDGLAVSFAGYAEPYLNRDCSKMVAYAVACGRRVQMYTTGVGMRDADVDALILARPSPCVLHLPDAAGDMKVNVTPDYAARMYRLADCVEGCRVVCYGDWHPMLMEMKRWAANYGLHSRAGNVTHLAQVTQRGPLKCRPAPGLDENVLLPDGRVALCCNDWALQHIIGDLVTTTWSEIHAGPVMAEMRRVMKAGEACLCQTCEFSERAH